MDSRLLNAFHDDPFDGNYTTYDDTNATDLWSNVDGQISLQLTETLDGILPIRAPHDVNALYSSDNSSFLGDMHTVEIKTEAHNNAVENLSNMVLYQDTAFDVITVDPNAIDYDSVDDEDEEEEEQEQHKYSSTLTTDADWLDETASQCSASTFRTRTDSSSIGDYESHSSDYDEEEKEEELITEDVIDNELNLPSFIKLDEFMLEKERHDSLNSEIDGLGVNIDVHNFDLADFITKDDFPMEIVEETEKQQHDVKTQNKTNLMNKSNQLEKTKSSTIEDDIIVDVESIEFDNEEEQWIMDTRKALAATDDVLQYKDNIKKDPSWIPQKTIKRKDETNTTVLNNGNKCVKKKTQNKKNSVNSKPKPRMERCSKNLAFIKQQLKASNGYISSPEKKKLPVVNKTEIKTVKKVLNLEEYKKRKSGHETKEVDNKNAKNHSDEVKEVVKSLREQQQQIQPLKLIELPTKNEAIEANNDPITKAKNKVLRMQAMKRAKQLKIIDSTISAKVPRVTKMLPLEEMMKANFCASSLNEPQDTAKQSMLKKQDKLIEEKSIQNLNLVSVTLLSIGCNTVISIPPFASVNLDHNVSRSLLKRVPKMTPHSLLTSIQDVVVQNNQPRTSQLIELGENKIIMHVPKESRLVTKKYAQSMSVQTEVLPEFPPLVLWPSRQKTRHSDIDVNEFSIEHEDVMTNHGGYTSSSHASSRRHRSSVSSSYSDSEQKQNYSRKRRTSYKQRRAKKHEPRSLSTSSTDSCVSNLRERSRSPQNCQRFNSRSRKNRANQSMEQPAVEERRIVYVGRIEDETTKEILRRKFIAYGPIRQITIHYKQTGMKYGFVTFERSQDAFQAIDNADKDAQINMYDISFGGRRAFCRASYADLDNAGINTYESYVFPQVAQPTNAAEDSFEQLLQKMKAKMAHTKKDVQ